MYTVQRWFHMELIINSNIMGKGGKKSGRGGSEEGWETEGKRQRKAGLTVLKVLFD